MVRPGLRSRSMKRKKVKKPGGNYVMHYWRPKPSKAVCAVCKKPLRGVPTLRPAKFKNIPKTKRRPNRPYGGTLCHKCLSSLYKETLLKQSI